MKSFNTVKVGIFFFNSMTIFSNLPQAPRIHFALEKQNMPAHRQKRKKAKHAPLNVNFLFSFSFPRPFSLSAVGCYCQLTLSTKTGVVAKIDTQSKAVVAIAVEGLTALKFHGCAPLIACLHDPRVLRDSPT